MSSSGIVIYYMGWGSQTPNPTKYTVLNGNFVFDLDDIFQQNNPGIQQDLPVLKKSKVRITILQNVFWTYNSPDTK